MRGQGDLAALRVGCQLVARFRDWHLTHANTETLGLVPVVISGTATKVDKFWSTQGPFELGLWTGHSWWIWKNVTIPRDVLEPGKTFKVELPVDSCYWEPIFTVELQQQGR